MRSARYALVPPMHEISCAVSAGATVRALGGANEGHNPARITTARPCHFRRRPSPACERTSVAMRSDIQPDSPLLTPAEVAALFRVDPKTVTGWAQQDKLHPIR